MLTDLRRERGEGCISDLTFDEWRAGELAPEDVQRAEEHVRGCSECSARRRSFDAGAEAFLAAVPSFHPPKALAPRVTRASRRSAGLLLGSAAAALALAATLVLLIRSPDGSGTRTKGGTASLGFFVKRGDRVERGADRESVRPGDVLRFTVSTARPLHVAVLGLDARGVASVYYPPAGTSRTVGPGRDMALDVGVELDDAPGEERLYGLFCESPADVNAARSELARAGTLERRQGCSVDVLRIEKDGKP
jgi:hypothetical protein